MGSNFVLDYINFYKWTEIVELLPSMFRIYKCKMPKLSYCDNFIFSI